MDSFLRRVLEQREREMETALIATPAEEFGRRPCELCGKLMSLDDDGVRRVCTACGGRKAQARLERLEAVEQRRQSLVDLALGKQREGVPMADETERRTCRTCQKPLRADNQHDRCSACRVGKRAAEDGDSVSVPSRRGASGDAKKNFRVVATALGFDADELLEDFMRGWLDRVKSSVRREEL